MARSIVTHPASPSAPLPRRVLVDTDVLSYLLRNDSRAAQFAPLLEGRVIVVSFQTVAELYRWALERGFGERRMQELEGLLRRLVVVPSRTPCARNGPRSTPRRGSAA
ncbi:PIN domain-containing protein [Tepidiforma bonchosmolovskayae]|uniref:Type II toxin-antitoxin system VapC family toxin n=1 Tax=Tepidiforma bonchosmolovskayae TaxID=2601677 RepID=A0ABX6C113_9CHLR|nr:PIN domain-containing protein [Tepidiforma bonchosmolovskayae]QFG02917.1 type II toxin-antitoxin system VapC family toxin [Tepidiforma bonchosmolovskayae]